MRVARRVFEEMAEAALRRLPEDFKRLLYNVQIEVRAVPGPEAGKWDGSKTLLGLYKGLTRGEMHVYSNSGSYMPARIVLYQRNLESTSRDEEDLARRVEETLRHEIAHHFGFDEEGIRTRLNKSLKAGWSPGKSAKPRRRR